MVIPIVGKCADIINIDVSMFNAGQCAFHNHLSNVRRAFESHWESFIVVLIKQHKPFAIILNFFVKHKGIILLTNIKFCENVYPECLAKPSNMIG